MTANVFFKKANTVFKKAGKLVKTEWRQRQEKKHPFKLLTDVAPADNWKKHYARFAKEEPIADNWILYESHAGSGMVCNPYAIFKAFLQMPEFKNYVHIWVIRDIEEKVRLEKEYAHLKNVFFVYYQSRGYAYFLAKSKYLINNTSFYSVFSKRTEQVYINTWHSITVKAIGYDVPDGRRLVNNMLRNLLMADYIISPNRFMTGIFNNTFRLHDICQGDFLEIGYPRNDLVVRSNREDVLAKMERRGTVVDRNKKIILYAPTWNGNNVGKPKIDIERYTALCEHFASHIDMNEYQLLIKPHQIEYRNFPTEERESGKYVSYTIDANELLSVVDILITDYSSIYFDFMPANKPILFYIPDFEEYTQSRGIYFQKEELPGPCCSDYDELASCINQIDTVFTDYQTIRNSTRSWACEFDDGHVSERVLDIVFRGNRDFNIKKSDHSRKKRILMYLGNLATNGVTSAALSLLKSIDYSKYDISVFALSLERADQNLSFDQIPSNVRTILRTAAPVLSPEDSEIYKRMLKEGIPKNPEDRKHLERIMRGEYVRIFGTAKFDHIVDFSGYGPYFPVLAALGNPHSDTKLHIWQHSDMYEDFSNEEKQTLNKRSITLETMLSCYPYFDNIVSSTKAVCALNRKKLATPETEDKFTFSLNLIDTDRIEAMKHDTSVEVFDDRIVYVKNESANGVKEYLSVPLQKGQIRFVTMGRCMPEKNHANIIRALKRLCDEGYDATLYIIGDGHLRAELNALAAELNIADRVIITGLLQNPFALMKECNCFIFPSIYEAQGLAVLEARIVGLPIVVSNYEAVRSVLMEDKQFILNGFDGNSIYEGMMAYIGGKIPNDYTFDVEEYNQKGLSDFDRLFN